MPVLTIHNYCDHIQMAGVLQVILPSSLVDGRVNRVPTVFLLAPEGQEGSRWLRHTQVELLAEKYQAAMVLVSCLEGCYTDMAFGYRFFQSLAKGIPEYLGYNLPPLCLENGHCFAAGCSIGGIGAVKWALSSPELFAAVGSFSGRLDNKESFQNPIEGDWLTKKRMMCLWGSPEAIQGTQNDLMYLWEQAVQAGRTFPSFYIAAGREDIGYTSSLAFAQRAGSKAHFAVREGRQDWPSWSRELELFLDWAIKGEKANVSEQA